VYVASVNRFEETKRMRGIYNRYLLIGLSLVGVCVLIYLVGVFYQSFFNNPLDFAALVFIIAIYVGALYHHLQRSEG
jgi:hypothetical protein